MARTFFQERIALKYGCNPHQGQASLFREGGVPLIIQNGSPSYINIMDAFNGWQLVREVDNFLKQPTACCFKHVSPAGAAFAPSLALAYQKAREADPLSAFGDFAVFSRALDEETAKVLQPLTTDGVLAPGYHPKALEILKKKRQGKMVLLEVDPQYEAPKEELREVFGVKLYQERNQWKPNPGWLDKKATKLQELGPEAEKDLVLAAITAKYTQSNSVVYALKGQTLGVGAGQQNRVECVRLAGRKADLFWLRQHPKSQGLSFVSQSKIAEKVNATVAYIQNFGDWKSLPEKDVFAQKPEPFPLSEQEEWLKTLDHVCLASDAFFPFSDSIEEAKKHGVRYIVQPGGSLGDEAVIQACDQLGMCMAFSPIRLFHH